MAGLLGDVLPWAYSQGDRAKRYLNGLLSDPIGSMQQTAGQIQDNHREMQGLLGRAWDGDRSAQERATQMAMNGPLGYAPVGMVKAGEPFTFIRNTAKSPNVGETFGQHIEPAGRYLIEDTGNVASKLPPGWESGNHTFKNPLFIDWGKGGYADADNWKRVLSDKYGGKSGKALSKALTKDGYDGIVTLKDGETSEIIDLSRFLK